jgi:hypothetical protein
LICPYERASPKPACVRVLENEKRLHPLKEREITMRKFILPAALAIVVGLAFIPGHAQASWLSELARHSRVEIYTPPVYAPPVYYAPPVCVAPPVYVPPVYVPSVTYTPAPSYYVAPSYYPYRSYIYPRYDYRHHEFHRR